MKTDQWKSCAEHTPPDDEPVLIVHKGEQQIGVRRWDEPNFEDTYERFPYWTDVLTETADWGDEDVQFWMPLPALP